MNWIQKTNIIVTKEEMRFNVLESEISEWLKDLRGIFETISEEELLSRRDEVNYEITLKTKKIKPSLLISIRSEKQEIIKKYLNEIIKKEWIKVSKSPITTSLFLILKSETNKKRPIIDYKKLNKEIVTDSTSLSLIGNMIDQKKRTRKILKKLLTTELRIKLFKSEFKKGEIKFLRHIVGQEDIKPDPKKIRMLKEWPRFTKIKEI